MRTRTTYVLEQPVPPADSTCYFSNVSGAQTNRATPVSVCSKVRSYRESHEIASDLDVTKRTFGHWNSFEHYRASTRLRTNSVVVRSYKFLGSATYHDRFDLSHPLWMWNDDSFGQPGNPTAGLVALYQPETDGHFIGTAGIDVDGLQVKALAAMLPSVRPQMSLVNSIIELKDFKRLPDSLRKLTKIISMVKDLAKRRGTTYARWLGRKTMRRALNSSADGYLTNQFAILPLLQDISGFQDALLNVDRQFRTLLALERRMLTRHYNVELDLGGAYASKDETGVLYTDSASKMYDSTLATGPSYATYTRPFNIVSCRMRRRTLAAKAKFHAECKFSYYLTRYQRERGYVLTLLDALGVNANPAIIWNAIPLTFVIDWVINIGKWLDQFKVQNMEPSTIVHSYLWSLTMNRGIEAGVILDANSPYFAPRYTPQVWFTESAYRRDVVTPPLSAALSTSGFSLKEFILSSAMLLSKHTRR